MKILMRGLAAALSGALVASAGLAAAQAAPAGQGQSQGPDLPTILHLRPDQLTAYHAAEDAGRDSPAVVAQMQAKFQRLAGENFLQRMDFKAEALNLQVARERRVMDAERKFYMVLTPAQQHTFDQVTTPHMQQGAAPH